MGTAAAQEGSGAHSDLCIPAGAVFSLFGHHCFSVNGSQGVITTLRTDDVSSICSFAAGSTWDRASQGGYVNGYVSYYGNGGFVFPTGSDSYRPLALSDALDAVVAHHQVAPSDISTEVADEIDQVSDLEYWQVSSNRTSTLSLSYDASSDVSLLGDLDDIRIIGFDGSTWRVIPSIVDAQSLNATSSSYAFNGDLSDAETGSITSTMEIDLSMYSYYTLGSLKKSAAHSDEASTFTAYPNPVMKGGTLIFNLSNITPDQGGTLTLHDGNNQVLRTYSVEQGQVSLRIPMNGLNIGTYWVNIRDEKGKLYHKQLAVINP